MCSVPYVGLIDSDDYVDIAAEVPSEAACKSLCSRTTHCEVYTYYTENDEYEPRICMMLSNSGGIGRGARTNKYFYCKLQAF